MRKKTKRALVFLISLVSLLHADALMSFKELTKLASEDLGKNIYLDKELPDYSVEINLADHQKRGEVYEFFKIVLFENNLHLQYNKRGDFFFIKEVKKKPEPLVAVEPMPVHKTLKMHYYTYRIKNITNKDVVEAMAIFPNVIFKFLKQSDMIAYSATRSDHLQVKRILRKSDNAVLHRTIKISLFSVNKNNLKELGASISAFEYGINSNKFRDIISSFHTKGTDAFAIASDGFNVDWTMKALEGWSVIDIFQSPTMRLTNGVESSVTSVVNVPYLRTTSTVDSTTNSTTEQYEYKDIGLQIKVNPKIKNDFIYLDLDLISEELISLDDDKPITQKVTYKNSVKITKGVPILLTGVQKTSTKFVKDNVPFLSDIPLLGELFKGTSTATENQNINILIEIL